MRSLDECRAEVFRRSEKRIEKRQKRRKMLLTCCVPLVLCVTLLAVCTLPDKKDTASGAVPEMMGGVNGGVSSVEIRGTGVLSLYSHRITEPLQVEEIYDYLQDFGTKGDTGGTLDGMPLPPSAPPFLEGGYTITFSNTGEVYTLSGNELTDEQTGQTVELSDSQLARLKELIGLD